MARCEVDGRLNGDEAILAEILEPDNRPRRLHGGAHPRAVARGTILALLLLPGVAVAQYTLTAENGDTVRFESAALRVMLDTARALYTDLEEDPRVAYVTPFTREAVSETDPEASYPWNVVVVVDDSTADLQRLPANLREADRAYYNYAVQRMRVVRGTDPDVPCDSVLALEERVVQSFVDGWVLSRTLYGGPAFAPLDELVFARHAGLLRPMLARLKNQQLGACAGQWVEANPERVAAYDAWRSEKFPAEEAAAEDEAPAGEPDAGDSTPDDGSALPEGSALQESGTGRDR